LQLNKNALEINWRDGRTSVEGQEQAAGALAAKVRLHQAVIEDFIDALRHNRKPMVAGREALISHELISAIEASSNTGAAVTLLPS
jgi:predicted dehydrogenase